MSDLWSKTTLGRSGLQVSRLGLGSSFALDADQVARAFERGINYFYWGSLRQPGFGAGIRHLAPRHRDEMVVAVQTYTRVAGLMRRSVESALTQLGIDTADLLLLGLWNRTPSERIRDAAGDLVRGGRARRVLISAHHRAAFGSYIGDPFYGAIMVRYNAAHPGAEEDVFPLLAANRPGVVGYTATRWRALLDRRLVPAAEQVPTATDCYRFVLSNPHVDVCLAGPANGAELDQAMAALDRGPLLPDELAWMRRVGRAVRDGARSSIKSRVMRAIDRLAGSPGR